MSKNSHNLFQNQKGFTLIELMVVIVILGVLAMYVGPRLMGRPGEAKQVKARVDIAAIETALKLYKLDNGVYPSTEQGLRALVEPPSTEPVAKNWKKGGYMEKNRVPQDPWKNDYIYLSPGTHGDYDIISYGADSSPGGDGEDADVHNWEIE